MKVYRLKSLCALLPLTAALWSVPAAAADGDTHKIRRLGNPATTISTKDTRTDAELKERVRQYRDALSVVLAKSTFDGDPQDFFDAVENGNFEQTSIPVGATFPWMAHREGGQPALLHNVEWAGDAPFTAWRITAETKAATFTFIIPGTCLNLALESKKPRPPLSCSLEATAAESTADKLGAVTIRGRATPSGDLTITGIGGPTKVIDAGQARAAGAGSWSFQPTEQGSYQFDASVRDAHGREATCSARVRVSPLAVPPKPQPVCSLTGSYDETTGVITLDGSRSKGDVTITRITAPEGGTIDATGSGGSYTFEVDKRTRRRGGEYVVSAEARIDDEVARCTDTHVLVPTPAGPDSRWIARGFGWTGDGDDKELFNSVGPGGAAQRNSIDLTSPDGFGASLEFLPTKRFGIEGGVLIGEASSLFVVDLPDQWGMADDEVDLTIFTLGVNFHLTPDRRADVYIGPFLGWVQYDDAEFNTLGRTFEYDYDDDFGFGAQIGVDVLFRREGRWGFTSALRYLQSSAELTGPGIADEIELDLDPLLFSAGISFRF